MTQEELVVKLTLDDSSLKSGISNATNSISNFSGVAENSSGKVSKLSGVASALGKTAAVGAAAASAAILKIGKDALTSYADYEQLIGGVETLFKDSASVVEGYANNAYKTAGLSANEYMETVTSFSASLLQSLDNDTEAAANAADMAIIDMADNANKMGTSMASIQNAYQGFAKQNYTMLDNLKLGYGGTKSEMERLLADAEKLSGVKYDISNLNDVYSAIHVVQTELGITGTTAKEASSTIQGSVAAMKSAWGNLITGIADENSDFEGLIGNFVDSVSTTLSNIIPRTQSIMTGVGALVEKAVPALLEMVPGLIENVLPGLVNSAFNAILAINNCIIDNFPMFIQTGVEALLQLADGLAQALPEMIPRIVDVVITITTTLLEHLPELIDAGIKLLEGLIEGIIKSIPKLVAALPKVIAELLNVFKTLPEKFVEIGKALLTGLAKGISSAVSSVIASAKEACNKILTTVKNFFGIHSPSKVFTGLGDYLMEGLANGITENGAAVDAVKNIATDIEDAFNPKLSTSLDSNLNSYDLNKSSLSSNGLQALNQQLQIDNLVPVLTQFTKQIISAINDVDMEVKIGDEVIARSAQRGNSSYRRRTGQALLV